MKNMADALAEAAKQIAALQKQVRKLQARNTPSVYMGWTNIPVLPTYASANLMTLAGVDLTAYFTIGVKCAWYQSGGWRYGYVSYSYYSGGDTNINLVINTSFVVANTDISAFKISYENPPNFQYWLNWAPTATGFSVAPAGLHQFCVHGRACHLVVRETSGTSNATNFILTLPINAAQVTNIALSQCIDNGAVIAGVTLGEINGANIALYTSTGGGGWTNTGNKYARFIATYPI